MEENTIYVTKWLRIMMYLVIISVLNSLTTLLPVIPSAATAWISRAIAGAFAYCLYKLSSVNDHYKKAAMYRMIYVICILAPVFLFSYRVLTLIGAVCSLLGIYQEYSAHGLYIQNKDSKLADRWRSLFHWGLLAGILVSFGSMTATVLIIAMAQAENTATITAVVLLVLSIPQWIVDILYICYIRKMIQISEQEPMVTNG